MLLQSLLRPVLTPLMRGMFDAPIFSSSAWSPLALWPDGIATPGMWISPRDLTSEWADYTGTTPVATPGTVADSSNPVGLALDIRAGATVLTDPGNHMLQSTSAARPLLSARVNLLTYSEDFSNAFWSVSGAGVTKENAIYTAPDGTLTGGKFTALGANSSVNHNFTSGTSRHAERFFVRAGSASALRFGINDGGWLAGTATVVSGSGSITGSDLFTLTGLDTNWTEVELVTAAAIPASSPLVYFYPGPASQSSGDSIGFWHPQLNLGPTALPYQRVGAASDYDASAGPTYQKYDGTDDSMATATFAAGTLTSSLDCLIAVRRDSAANGVLISEASGSYFGAAIGGGGAPCNAGAGSATVWVDGTQLTGGTSVTQATLEIALTPGAWHIAEFRGLNLSSWTLLGASGYGGSMLNGALGDILLYPSTASTEDKDAARQWLADYYGVTLP